MIAPLLYAPSRARDFLEVRSPPFRSLRAVQRRARGIGHGAAGQGSATLPGLRRPSRVSAEGPCASVGGSALRCALCAACATPGVRCMRYARFVRDHINRLHRAALQRIACRAQCSACSVQRAASSVQHPAYHIQRRDRWTFRGFPTVGRMDDRGKRRRVRNEPWSIAIGRISPAWPGLAHGMRCDAQRWPRALRARRMSRLACAVHFGLPAQAHDVNHAARGRRGLAIVAPPQLLPQTAQSAHAPKCGRRT